MPEFHDYFYDDSIEWYGHGELPSHYFLENEKKFTWKTEVGGAIIKFKIELLKIKVANEVWLDVFLPVKCK